MRVLKPPIYCNLMKNNNYSCLVCLWLVTIVDIDILEGEGSVESCVKDAFGSSRKENVQALRRRVGATKT